MKKCIQTHGKSLPKRIDLKTEDADRWQQSLQHVQFIMVVAATNTRPEHPSFETAVDTISDLLKVRRVRKSWLAATSHRGSRGNIHAIILIVD